jgi:hypothetical protein
MTWRTDDPHARRQPTATALGDLRLVPDRHGVRLISTAAPSSGQLTNSGGHTGRDCERPAPQYLILLTAIFSVTLVDGARAGVSARLGNAETSVDWRPALLRLYAGGPNVHRWVTCQLTRRHHG